MKLAELRSAIRKMKGNPSVIVELTEGKPMVLVLQKVATLETLGSVYGDTKEDIGLDFDEETGIISGPLTPRFEVVPDLEEAMSPVAIVTDDEDDML